MIISPARAMHHYPTRDDNLLVCDSYVDASYMIAFSYPILLIVVCTVYAVLTRKIPEAFNESKHIGELLDHEKIENWNEEKTMETILCTFALCRTHNVMMSSRTTKYCRFDTAGYRNLFAFAWMPMTKASGALVVVFQWFV